MKHDFDTRNPGPDSIHAYLLGAGITDPSVTPHSVADMRFNIAPEISVALHSCVNGGGFGYACRPLSYFGAVCSWMKKRHGLAITKDCIVPTHGVVTAMAVAVRAFTKAGDGIIVQTPIYPPFRKIVAESGRTLLENPLVFDDGGYHMDFFDLRAKAKSAKMLLLCSPHNPSGRVWTQDELRQLGDICLENDLIVVSDEIHEDIVFPPHKHIPITVACPELKSRSVICTAPSKSFNIPGLSVSNAIIENPEMRARYSVRNSSDCGSYLNALGDAALVAAYSSGMGWLNELIVYLKENSELLRDFFAKNIPAAYVYPIEGTFLQLIDMSFLGDEVELTEYLIRRAKLVISPGKQFGLDDMHIRFNFACPRADLQASLDRLLEALTQDGFV